MYTIVHYAYGGGGGGGVYRKVYVVYDSVRSVSQ